MVSKPSDSLFHLQYMLIKVDFVSNEEEYRKKKTSGVQFDCKIEHKCVGSLWCILLELKKNILF